MTRDEEHARSEGKVAYWCDHRDQHLGSRSKCPYTVPHKVRAWNDGYHEEATRMNPTVQLDAEAEQRRLEMVAALQAWLERNK